MKNNFSKLFCLLVAFVMLTMGVAAFAETQASPEIEQIKTVEEVTEEPDFDEPQDEAAEPEAEEPAEEEPIEEEPEEPVEEESEVEAEYEDTQYLDALTAFNKARLENQLNALKEELAKMVENKQLTQEQSDLILSRMDEQQISITGVAGCQNCRMSGGMVKIERQKSNMGRGHGKNSTKNRSNRGFNSRW